MLIFCFCFIILGCFRLGTGIKGNTSLIRELRGTVDSALSCQALCKKEANCKLFNWNSNSRNCFLRSDLPKGPDSFSDVTAGVVGAKDCSNFEIIWPEIFPREQETATTSTITTLTTTTATTATTTATTTTTTTTTTTATSTSTTSQITSATRAADMEIPEEAHILPSKRYLKINWTQLINFTLKIIPRRIGEDSYQNI
jgi:hypothetical protein